MESVTYLLGIHISPSDQSAKCYLPEKEIKDLAFVLMLCIWRQEHMRKIFWLKN
jgi:hypothetical protein